MERPRTPKSRWALLAAATATLVVSGEYLINALLNPGMRWSPRGVAAHMALDVVAVVPLVALALVAAAWAAGRLGMRWRDGAGFLGRIGLTAIAFLLLVVPWNASRDSLHERFGEATGLSIAKVRTTVVKSDLTVQEATQLCSFASVRAPALARDGAGLSGLGVGRRLETAARDGLAQLAIFLPLLVLAFGRRMRRRGVRWSLDPLTALMRRSAPSRLTLAGVGALAFVLFVALAGDAGGAPPPAGAAQVYDACEDGGPTRHYDVSAIDVTITLNRWGDHVEGAYMYALDANVPAIRAFEDALEQDRQEAEGLAVARVSHGLRDDLIQPLVIRANLGECLSISFTNELADGQPASMHILGLPHSADSASSAVGNNPDTTAGPGETLTYEIPIPLDRNAERAYYFHDHGAGRRRQNMGLFGAIVVEPEGATYLDVETGEPLDTVTGSNWEAIIVDPNEGGNADGKSFREFVILYHEIGDEAFTDIKDRDDFKLPLIDELAGIYRPAARALNYRSEPFRHRIAQDNETNGDAAGHGKSLGYGSYSFGDPATPIPRSYVGEATKTRLLHGGSEVFHVHHLHGGGDRWRRNPDADPNSDFWKGLTKVPDPLATSIRLDSQSIGPGTSYNLEHECGAGGCQQGVGDFLYHCHIGHHYLSGMWSFWRVFGTTQTVDSNLYGRPLAVVPELFQADNVFADDEAASNTPPATGVTAGDLIGLVVDDGRTVVADADVANPDQEIGVLEWVRQQLPPAGVPLDSGDATVWNWVATGAGSGLRIFGEPESAVAFPNWVSPMPGVRPEVLFNPKNGRYTWPLFRPQVAQRPPFTARHSGAPWLGDEMKDGRFDGLCARNGVHPEVDVGDAVDRFYPVSAITLPIDVTADRRDPDGMIFVLNEHERDIREGRRATEPLAIRSNVGDCVEVLLTNKIPDGPLNKDFSKVNIHSHFVQFDTQASDGVITGFSYEQSVRPIESEDRVLTADVSAGATVLPVNQTDRLRPGIWIGVGLGEGVCGRSDVGQPVPCTEVRRIEAIPDARTLVLDEPLDFGHRRDQAVGVEFVRYRWYSDVDFGTVFFHTHVDFKDWDRGLFGAHVVEPKGSTYHDPATGAPVRAGTLVDVRVDPNAGGSPVAAGVNGSFREFMLFLHNNNPAEGRFVRGGGTINLRAEPWRLRDGADPAYRLSSVVHDDPHTQEIRAYVGDPVVIRGTGLVERVGGVRFAGHRFQQERHSAASDTRDTTFIGISERFDVSLEGGAGGPAGLPGDFLYYSTLGKDFESGAWGLLRAYDSAQPDLEPLPGIGLPVDGGGFPRLAFTGQPPPAAPQAGAGGVCPDGAPVKGYRVSITDASIIYNDFTVPDVTGVAYQPRADVQTSVRTPLVMRINAGDCLRLELTNERGVRSSIGFGELLFDPQSSSGSAVGLNADSTIAPGATRSYQYYADRELGIVLGLNLGDLDSVERGAFAAVVVEPEGSTYRRPGLSDPLPFGGVGVQADIVTPDHGVTREFVALFSDEDRRIGQNAMPYPVEVERFAGISYAHEPLDLRDMVNRPTEVFRSSLWGDPRHVITVPRGTPLVYRVAQPWGNQMHVPSLEGHRFALEPLMDGSEHLANDLLAPGMSLDWKFTNGAGAGVGSGDFLFLDRRQPFLEWGLWNILRVTEDASVRGADTVTVLDLSTEVDGAGARVDILGLNGTRPAGDTASRVSVFAGERTASGCEGPLLGTAEVDRGNGRWQLRAEADSAPETICVESSGGGVSEAEN